VTRIGEQLREDRALRDAAREVFHQGFAHVRAEATPEALGARIANRIGEKTDAVSDKAADLAERHGTKAVILAAVAASAAALWWAREPIMSGISRLRGRPKNNTGDREPAPQDEDSDDE